MTHIYLVASAKAKHERRREIAVAEINVLRKFEGKQMIEERIDANLDKLHELWFKKAK